MPLAMPILGLGHALAQTAESAVETIETKVLILQHPSEMEA
jgi:hypothetical protein